MRASISPNGALHASSAAVRDSTSALNSGCCPASELELLARLHVVDLRRLAHRLDERGRRADADGDWWRSGSGSRA
jgi:hypothetical protein